MNVFPFVLLILAAYIFLYFIYVVTVRLLYKGEVLLSGHTPALPSTNLLLSAQGSLCHLKMKSHKRAPFLTENVQNGFTKNIRRMSMTFNSRNEITGFQTAYRRSPVFTKILKCYKSSLTKGDTKRCLRLKRLRGDVVPPL